ncbi:MAG: phage tail protein [Gammaproteobacteria bacterium]
MPDTDIYRNYNFVLEMGQGNLAWFTEVEDLSIKVPAIAYRAGGEQAAVRKLPGRVEYGDITLRWGLTESLVLWEWLMTGVNGNIERREVSIILLKPDGQGEQTRWNLHNAWATEWRGAKLDALAQGAAIETLVLTHEGLTRA